jgi:sporulation integral membrane protein YlbJ
MKPLFNIRGEGSFALIMGIISGYPIGAKIATQFRENNVCSKEECERLLSFTNNSGPLFIIGTVGISMFGNSTIGLLLFITHILACITVGILFRFWKYNSNSFKDDYLNSYNKKSKKNNDLSFSSLGEIIGNSITNSISTIMMIGGFVVLFSVVISILNSSKVISVLSLLLVPLFNMLNIPTSFISPFLTGLVEITNGINIISSIPMKMISVNIIFTSFLLGFGGVSILLQVFSIVSKTDLSIKPYVIGKLLHGIFAAFYTYIFIYCFPIFNFNL